jgi:outer membrane protein TolC
MSQPSPRVTAAGRPLLCVTLALLLTVPASRVGAQEPVAAQEAPQIQVFSRADADRVMSLQEAVDLSLGRSFSVYQLEQQYLQISYGLENAKRQLRTRIDFNSTLPAISQAIDAHLINTAPGINELFYLRTGATWAQAGVNIVQPLITNGRIVLLSNLVGFDAFNELPGGSRVDSRSVQPSLGIRFTQPLFQFNAVKGQLQDATMALESLTLRYTEEELRLINQVSRQFYSLVAQQRVLELAMDRYIQSDRNYNSGVRRQNAGLIPESDVLRLAVTRANDEDALESARNQLELQQFAFNRLVGLTLDEQVWAEARLEYQPVEVDLDRALELAFANRSDLRRAEIDLDQTRLEVRRTVSQGRPDLQLNIGYDITGNSSLSAMPTDDWGKHFKEALDPDNRSPNTNVSLTLNIPLFDWGRNASLVQRRLSEARVLERQVDETREDLRQRVTDRVRAVESAMRRLLIQQQNVQVALTSYDFTQKRYARGEITVTELATAQDQLSQTQINLLNAQIAFELAKADLKEITLWDWEANQPVSQRTTPPQPFRER